MFGMSWAEIIIILAVGMFVLGPERIPVAVKWVGSTLKTVRTMAAGAQEQLRGEFGPELEELRRQVEELQGLKEIQELRKLRDLNPRSMITKNILGEEFSGGIGGFLGLNQNTDAAGSTGSGVAPQPIASETIATEPIPPEPVSAPIVSEQPASQAVRIDEPSERVEISEPVALTKSTATSAPRHAAAASFDLDAT